MQALVETGKKFNELSKKLADHGMKIGYHCHGGDFEPVEGKIPWVVFGENTDPEVILQLDIGNAIGGGGDAIAMLKHFPGRSISVHLKEHGGPAGAVIGEGDGTGRKSSRSVNRPAARSGTSSKTRPARDPESD